jgi:hypothetical protein
MQQYTPEPITNLKPNEIFVFGSNESGIHGAGAARTALSFGAKMGKGFGPSGQTFAIPTKDWNIETLSIPHIAPYITRFLDYTRNNPNLIFLVTKIGCGLAGHTIESIAPLFQGYPPNVILPEEFLEINRLRLDR